jgi:hypothetical protein
MTMDIDFIVAFVQSADVVRETSIWSIVPKNWDWYIKPPKIVSKIESGSALDSFLMIFWPSPMVCVFVRLILPFV